MILGICRCGAFYFKGIGWISLSAPDGYALNVAPGQCPDCDPKPGKHFVKLSELSDDLSLKVTRRLNKTSVITYYEPRGKPGS